MPNDSKHIQASLLLISTDWSRLRVVQVPRCRDLVIFVVTTDRRTDRQTDYFTPAHARKMHPHGRVKLPQYQPFASHSMIGTVNLSVPGYHNTFVLVAMHILHTTGNLHVT